MIKSLVLKLFVFNQWLFLVPLVGGRWHIIPQKAIYKWYILPIGGLYATYHLLREPEKTIGSIWQRTGLGPRMVLGGWAPHLGDVGCALRGLAFRHL